jgi:transcriptional regulator with XRE-family HTH domain
MQVLFVSQNPPPEDAAYTDGMTKRSILGERIALARQAAGLSQKQLAERLGVSQQMVGYLEVRPVAIRPELLTKLSAALGLPVEELLGKVDRKRHPTGPTGRVRRVFDEVSRLPRKRQQRIVSVVEDMLTAQRVAS